VSWELHGHTAQSRHLLDDESQIGHARRAAQALAEAHKLDATITGRVGIAATELATNLWRHARQGELLLQPILGEGAVLIELLAIDRGPGMASVERCLSDGYSTGGTSGTGLGAVRRLAQVFDIHSELGEGTAVLARIGTGAPASPNFGAVSVAMSGELDCGDAWRLATAEEQLAVLVADGLGHGSAAAAAAQAAAAAFASDPFGAPSDTLRRANRTMSGTRGGAVACACLRGDGTLQYAGVGNIAGALLSGERRQGLVSHNGILGIQVRKLQQFDYRAEAHAVLVMHTDGISARWERPAPALLGRHPAIIAAVLYRDHARSHDDATVVVVGT